MNTILDSYLNGQFRQAKKQLDNSPFSLGEYLTYMAEMGFSASLVAAFVLRTEGY